MKKIKIFCQNKRGVSPVIGVILMVAITVILAAVIGAFVLGLGDSVEEEIRAGASISTQDDNTVVVTYTSEGTSTQLEISHTQSDGSAGALNDTTLTDVGDTASGSYSDGDTLIVVATDGTKSTVIAQREL